MPIATPNTPSAWKQFARLHSIPSLPYVAFTTQDRDGYIQRDVYVDAADALAAGSKLGSTEVYSDVLAFQDAEPTVTVPNDGYVTLTTRVITSTKPMTITVNFAGANAGTFIIYAAQLDQPLSIITGSAPPFPVDLGKSSPNVGIEFSVSQSVVTHTYYQQYIPLDSLTVEAMRLAQTQLRIASIMFWLAPDISLGLSSYVAQASATSQKAATLSISASALAKQLAIGKLEGRDTAYAPPLTLDTYKKTLDGAIDVTASFSQAYDNFTRQEASIKDQQAAWDTMLGHAQDIFNMQSKLADDAATKWESARKTMNAAVQVFALDKLDLEDKQARFKTGVWDFKHDQKLAVAAKIIFAIVSFALAAAELCLGDPGGAVAAPKAAEAAIEEASEAAKEVSRLQKTIDDLKKVKAGLETIAKLYDLTTSIEKTLKSINKDSKDLPSMSASDSATPDVDGLMETAAWDKWALAINQSIAHAVEVGIKDSEPFQLALQKHAVDGKLVTQCRVEAIKAAHEYFERQLALNVAQKDFARLQELRKRYHGEIEAAAQAKEAFYDRKMSAITSVLVDMRKAVSAYKYMSLQDSKVVLDPLKSIEDYKADAQTLVDAVTDWREKQTSDFAPISESMLANEIAPAGTLSIVDSLKRDGRCVFTLAPRTSLGSTQVSSPGPFDGYSYVRITGMRVFLIGATAKNASATSSMELTISNTGIFSDISKDQVYSFVMRPDSRKFKYRLGTTVALKGEDVGIVEVDSLIPSTTFADPTPFTQWTIKINKPSLYDLDGLTNVKFFWKGTVKSSDE